MGPGPTTLQLVRLLPAQPTGAVLDFGCGAGTIALVAASRGAPVAIGTDINARAIEIARFNAQLNGLEADFRYGDLLEPVAGIPFDLVVAQPPYVSHPPGIATTTYLHGGPRGDEIAMRLVPEVARALAPGGRALILMDDAVRKGDLLSGRLRDLLGDAPVDLVILAAPGASADLQSIGYALLDSPRLGDDYSVAVRRYRDHLDDLGVEEFRHCLALLRVHSDHTRSGGRFTIQLRVRSLPKDDGTLNGILASLDLAALDDDTLRHRTVRAWSGARWVEERLGPNPASDANHFVRYPTGDFHLDHELSEAGRTLIEVLESTETIDAAVHRYARICDAPPDEVREHVIDFVREGLSRGTLEPGRPGPDGGPST
jgi:SAM-dependent methyltransferase